MPSWSVHLAVAKEVNKKLNLKYNFARDIDSIEKIIV